MYKNVELEPWKIIVFVKIKVVTMRHSREFWGTGEKDINLRGTKANFEGNKDNNGEQGTLESKFSILGEQGNKPIYFREQRNRYPLIPPPSGGTQQLRQDDFFGQKRF